MSARKQADLSECRRLLPLITEPVTISVWPAECVSAVVGEGRVRGGERERWRERETETQRERERERTRTRKLYFTRIVFYVEPKTCLTTSPS